MNTKPLTKGQIETASDLLIHTLNQKRDEIAKAAYKKDLDKHAKAVIEFKKKALTLHKDAEKLDTIVRKGTHLQVKMDGYGTFLRDLPKNEQEVENMNILEVRSGKKYSDDYGDYRPELANEAKEVEKFILGMKLGTVLMADLQPLLDKLAKIN